MKANGCCTNGLVELAAVGSDKVPHFRSRELAEMAAEWRGEIPREVVAVAAVAEQKVPSEKQSQPMIHHCQ